MMAGLALVIIISACAFAGAEEYETLELGMKGPAVKRLKVAMYWLGYFKTDNVSDAYNDVMVERVKQLQRNNGLEETGIADPALQELVYSGNAVKTATAPRPSPVPPTPVPVQFPQSTPRPPALTAEGFLAEDDEYVYADAAEGLWIYISQDLAIDLRRYTDAENKQVWFEADIHCSPEAPLTSFLPETPIVRRAKMVNPIDFARKKKVVLAFSDDQFGDRINGGSRPGIIVRNGEIIAEKTVEHGKGRFPNLEVLAVFADGRLKTFNSDAHTAQEYLDMGVVSTYAFGPILISEGQLSEYMLRAEYYSYREPRCAIGMIAPYHYVLIVVNGRNEAAKGQYLNWVADRMLELGVVEALNLDGGGTTALMFMGTRINRTGSDIRQVSGISGFGYSEKVQ